MSPASFDGAHATIRSAWTHVDGLRIHARTGGRTGAARVRDVVLVHGVVVSSRYMVPLALELGRDFRVHAPDLPGFGLSEHPTDVLGVADLAQTLVAWLDHCRIERPALVANSFGCQIALHALARRPNRFDCAVLQGPTFDRRAGPLRQGLRWLATGLHEQPSLNAGVSEDLCRHERIGASCLPEPMAGSSWMPASVSPAVSGASPEGERSEALATRCAPRRGASGRGWGVVPSPGSSSMRRSIAPDWRCRSMSCPTKCASASPTG